MATLTRSLYKILEKIISKYTNETKHQSILHFSKKTIFPLPISPITLPFKVFNNFIFLLSFDKTMPVLVPDIKLL